MKPEQILTGLQSPCGLAFDADDVCFVSEAATGRIVKTSPEGRIVTFAETGRSPAGIAFDDSGDLFVAETGRYHVLLISPDEAIKVYASQCKGRRFVGPRALTFSPTGNVLFTDSGEDSTGAVFRADLDGEVKLITGDLSHPSGIVLAEDSVSLFVSESSMRRIVCLELDENEDVENRETFIEFDDGGDIGSILFDSQGTLYVAREGLGITTVDPDGNVTGTISLPGERPAGMVFGGLNYDELFVAETDTGNIYRLQSEQPGQRPFAGPRSV
jgi:sugar lactone lactonase YvrE